MIVLYLEQDSFSFSLHSTVGFELVTQLKGAFWVCMHTPSCYDKATIKNCNIFNEYIFVVSPQKLPDWIILPFCFNWMHTADSPKGYWGLSCFMYGTFYKVANIFTWTNNRELSKTKKNHTQKKQPGKPLSYTSKYGKTNRETINIAFNMVSCNFPITLLKETSSTFFIRKIWMQLCFC